MVPLYLDAIQKLQPHGPYFSDWFIRFGRTGNARDRTGGLLAQGQNIARLIMLDSYPHFRQLSSARTSAGYYPACPTGHLSEIIPIAAPPRPFSYMRRRWLHRVANSRVRQNRRPRLTWPELRCQGSSSHNSYTTKLRLGSGADIGPKFYPGKITFLRSENRFLIFPEIRLLFGLTLAAEFECTDGARRSSKHAYRALCEFWLLHWSRPSERTASLLIKT